MDLPFDILSEKEFHASTFTVADAVFLRPWERFPLKQSIREQKLLALKRIKNQLKNINAITDS